MWPFVQLFHLTLIVDIFVITNSIRCLIIKFWLLPCEFNSSFKTEVLDPSEFGFVAEKIGDKYSFVEISSEMFIV